MSINSRAKGCRGELDASKFSNKTYPWTDLFRSQQHKGHKDAADIIGNTEIHYEVKRVEKLRIWPAIVKLAKEAAGKVYGLLHRRNREEWLFTTKFVALDDFAEQWIREKRAAGYGPEWRVGDPPIESGEAS